MRALHLWIDGLEGRRLAAFTAATIVLPVLVSALLFRAERYWTATGFFLVQLAAVANRIWWTEVASRRGNGGAS
jgi:hypothetical protein